MGDDHVVEVAQVSAGQCWADPALLQENEAKIAALYLAAADEVDVLVCPELALTGYIPLKGYDQHRKRILADVASRATHDVVPRLADLTRGRRASLVVGLMESASMRNEMFNSVVLVEDGEVLATYRKIHLPVEENHYFVPGEEVTVADSRLGRMGLSICYDMLFPEVGRIAALRGAELVCVCSNWLGIGNLRRLGEHLPVARALENQYHVVFVNGVGDLEVRGRTWALHGCSKIVTATGEVVALAGAEEESLRGVLTGASLDEGHDIFPVLRDRRPHLYHPLVAPLSATGALGSAGAP